MKYDFDSIVNRRHTNCYKWDEAGIDDLIPLWVADMDFEVAPAITRALNERVDHGVFGYTLVPDSYYDAIINWFGRRHGWAIEREWIQYTTGVVPAVSVVIKALTQPGDQVIVQTPVYNCFFTCIRNNGCEVVENPLLITPLPDGFTYTIDFDDLEQKAADPRAKLLLLCNPHNPAGRVWRKDELERINDICMRHGVRVLADEIHCELVYRDNKFVPFASVSEECQENSITCNSPSKSFNTAGLQIANIICNNPSTRELINRAININEVCDVNPFGVIALQEAYNNSEDWLVQLCEYLDGNYQALRRFFNERLPNLPLARLEGTYLVWVDIRPTGMTSDQLADLLLRECRVQVNSGTMYGQQTGEGFIRINIATQRSRLMEGLRRMERVLCRKPTLPKETDSNRL